MLGEKSIPCYQNRYLISHIAKIDPCGTSEKILIKLKDAIYFTLFVLMAEIIYCLGSEIKRLSGFNVLGTL